MKTLFRFPANVLSLVKFQYGLNSASAEKEVEEKEDDPSRFWGLQAATADKEVSSQYIPFKNNNKRNVSYIRGA